MENLALGGFAGVMSRTCTAPLELWKIQRQNPYLPHTTLRETLRLDGVRGLWKGNLTNCVRLFPQYAINYFLYQQVLQRTSTLLYTDHLVAASLAGFGATIVTYPLDNIRTRLALQTQKTKYTGIVDVFRKVPLSHLYQGLRMTLIGFVPFNALNFTFYELYRDHLPYPFLAGGCAGMSAVTFTYPTDLIRRRLQLQGYDATVPRVDGILDCVRSILRQDGVRGLYRGLGVCYLKLFPTAAIQFWILNFNKSKS